MNINYFFFLFLLLFLQVKNERQMQKRAVVITPYNKLVCVGENIHLNEDE